MKIGAMQGTFLAYDVMTYESAIQIFEAIMANY